MTSASRWPASRLCSLKSSETNSMKIIERAGLHGSAPCVANRTLLPMESDPVSDPTPAIPILLASSVEVEVPGWHMRSRAPAVGTSEPSSRGPGPSSEQAMISCMPSWER
eukprot:3817835-Prymnesium_polylepis.1